MSVKTDNGQTLVNALNRIDELESLNEKLTAALKEKMICGEGAYVLRKQAEAVEHCWNIANEASSLEWAINSIADYQLWLVRQADAIEKGERDE